LLVRLLQEVLDYGTTRCGSEDRAKWLALGITASSPCGICVAVSPFFWGSVYRAAERAFVRLEMNRTRRRNGVLLFVVPSRRAFVILDDAGIHEHAGDAFWRRVVDEMSPLF
jgi:hypothetical protein